jgi:hypothetical protein
MESAVWTAPLLSSCDCHCVYSQFHKYNTKFCLSKLQTQDQFLGHELTDTHQLHARSLATGESDYSKMHNFLFKPAVSVTTQWFLHSLLTFPVKHITWSLQSVDSRQSSKCVQLFPLVLDVDLWLPIHKHARSSYVTDKILTVGSVMTSNFAEHSSQFPLTYVLYAEWNIQCSSVTTLLATHTMSSSAGLLPLPWHRNPLLSSLTDLHTLSNRSQVATQPHSHTVTLITTNYTTGATFPHLLLPSVCKNDYSQLREDDSKSRYCHVIETAKAWNDNPHL